MMAQRFNLRMAALRLHLSLMFFLRWNVPPNPSSAAGFQSAELGFGGTFQPKSASREHERHLFPFG
jgi:hypothetical protein